MLNRPVQSSITTAALLVLLLFLLAAIVGSARARPRVQSFATSLSAAQTTGGGILTVQNSGNTEVSPQKENVTRPPTPTYLALPTTPVHVVTIGDSLTRYQFLALAYQLHTQRTDIPAELVYQGRFRTWSSYFNYTTEFFRGAMSCDCLRGPALGGCKGRTTPCMVENRRYKHPTAPLWLTHLHNFGDMPMTAQIPLNETSPPLLTDQTVESLAAASRGAYGPLAYSTDLLTVLREHLPTLRPQPTHIVFNAGPWPHRQIMGNLEQIVQAILAVTPNFIYKESSTPRYPGPQLKTERNLTAWQRYENPDRDVDKAMRKQFCGARKLCTFLPFRGPRPRDEYYDGRHFVPSVYREWNEALWERIIHPPQAPPATRSLRMPIPPRSIGAARSRV